MNDENERVEVHERYRNFGKVYLTTIIAASLVIWGWFEKNKLDELFKNESLKNEFVNWVLFPLSVALVGSFIVLGIYFVCYLIEARELNWSSDKEKTILGMLKK